MRGPAMERMLTNRTAVLTRLVGSDAELAYGTVLA